MTQAERLESEDQVLSAAVISALHALVDIARDDGESVVDRLTAISIILGYSHELALIDEELPSAEEEQENGQQD